VQEGDDYTEFGWEGMDWRVRSWRERKRVSSFSPAILGTKYWLLEMRTCTESEVFFRTGISIAQLRLVFFFQSKYAFPSISTTTWKPVSEKVSGISISTRIVFVFDEREIGVS